MPVSITFRVELSAFQARSGGSEERLRRPNPAREQVSFKAAVARRRSVVFVNPGSAGPRRFRLPVTVATMALRSSL
jgi:hypothetical protein